MKLPSFSIAAMAIIVCSSSASAQRIIPQSRSVENRSECAAAVAQARRMGVSSARCPDGSVVSVQSRQETPPVQEVRQETQTETVNDTTVRRERDLEVRGDVDTFGRLVDIARGRGVAAGRLSVRYGNRKATVTHTGGRTRTRTTTERYYDQ
jgi:hypothetical protein